MEQKGGKQMPEVVQELLENLSRTLNEDQSPCISIDKAAKVLGVDNETLRVAIANGTCPFGFGGSHRTTGSRFGKVSKIALWSFLTM